MQPSPNEGLKPLRKMRALSGFNTWHAEYLQSAESKTLPTLAAKNKKSAELWRELSSEQQTMYKERAAAVNVGITGINTKNESKKIYSLLQDVSEHANVVPGFHLMFVAVHNGKHVVGGSEIGGKFLQESGSHIPYSFLGYLSATKSSSCNSNLLSASSDHKPSKEDHDSKESLRRAVENLFNLRYGQSIGDTAARLPYRKIKEFGISMDGLPEDKSLKHPSSYGRLTLKEILANKDNITVTVSNHPSIQHHQERLATGSTDSSRMDTNGIVITRYIYMHP